MKTKSIKDLYFGCINYNFNTGRFEEHNLFGSMRVLRAIATYRTHGKELEKSPSFNPLMYCFGDLWGHVEYEMMVQGIFNDNSVKMSLWDMYVVPNAQLLMEMVNSVSVNSCREWLKSHK